MYDAYDAYFLTNGLSDIVVEISSIRILISSNWQDHEMDMHELEAARLVYITAVAAAKELQNEESISAAARARFHLQSLVVQQS